VESHPQRLGGNAIVALTGADVRLAGAMIPTTANERFVNTFVRRDRTRAVAQVAVCNGNIDDGQKRVPPASTRKTDRRQRRKGTWKGRPC